MATLTAEQLKQNQPEQVAQIPEPTPTEIAIGETREVKRNYQVLGKTTEEQQAYIKKMDELAKEKERLETEGEKAKTPEDKKKSSAAVDDVMFSQARESRLAFIRTHGGLDTESQGNRDKRKQLTAKVANFDTMPPSTLYMLAAHGGYDLVPLCMAYADPQKDRSPTADTLAVGDALVANFGNNSRINAIVGCADVLPPTVSRAKIAGKEGYLLTGNPELDKATVPAEIYDKANKSGIHRPGYYQLTGSSWDYLPIYHGTTVEVTEMRILDAETIKRYAAARKERGDLVRMWDIMDNNGQPLSDLPEDKELAERAKQLAADGKLGKPASADGLRAVHNVGDADYEGRKKAAIDVFGEGAATNLLFKYEEQYGKPDIRMQTAGKTGPSGIGIARMIALGYHEGGLVGGRQNPDPASGFNIGTFQIGGTGSTPESSMRKYQECLARGAAMAGISTSEAQNIQPPLQRDLLAHFGYIELQRGGASTFEKLFDPNLGYNDTVELMHKKIQGGIRAIGEHVWSLTQPSKSVAAV